MEGWRSTCHNAEAKQGDAAPIGDVPVAHQIETGGNLSMPTGVFRQNNHQRLAAIIARLAEGRETSGIAIAGVPDGLRRAAKLVRQP